MKALLVHGRIVNNQSNAINQFDSAVVTFWRERLAINLDQTHPGTTCYRRILVEEVPFRIAKKTFYLSLYFLRQLKSLNTVLLAIKKQ